MKRYMLFGWDVYYPQGGMNDFIKDFDQEDFDEVCHEVLVRTKKDSEGWEYIEQSSGIFHGTMRSSKPDIHAIFDTKTKSYVKVWAAYGIRTDYFSADHFAGFNQFPLPSPLFS